MVDRPEKGWLLGDSAPVDWKQPYKRRRSRRMLWLFAPLLLVIAIIARFGSQFFSSEAFPKLPPGIYAGVFSGYRAFGGEREWILKISEEYKHIEAIFLGSESAVYPVQRDSSGYLMVEAADQKIILKGAAGNGEVYGGQFETVGSGKTGDWKLRPITLESFEVDPSFNQWMLLRAEVARTEHDIEIAKKLIPAQKTEIEELSSVITDEGAMKERGSSRIKELEDKKRIVSQALSARKAEMLQAENQLALAQKVSARGKLTSLARESNERETRWARSLLVGSYQASALELDGAVEHAEELSKLKEALLLERQLVEQLEEREPRR